MQLCVLLCLLLDLASVKFGDDIHKGNVLVLASFGYDPTNGEQDFDFQVFRFYLPVFEPDSVTVQPPFVLAKHFDHFLLVRVLHDLDPLVLVNEKSTHLDFFVTFVFVDVDDALQMHFAFVHSQNDVGKGVDLVKFDDQLSDVFLLDGKDGEVFDFFIIVNLLAGE